MPESTVLLLFIPTFLFISITPGMCMSLAMTLGMSIGFKRTLWMMLGEVLGVATVATFALIGVAGLFMQYPNAFTVFKWTGGIYLLYIGIKLIRTPVHLSMQKHLHTISNAQLTLQGFITAIANPKGWAFMIAILPPFINQEKPLAIQMVFFIGIIMLSEFVCMCIYATGGKGLNSFLNKSDKRQWVNRIGGGLLIAVGIWLGFS